MNKNQYDYDVTIWSPQGRLHQVEYAMEAVKLGSACVGLKSKTHAVVCAVKRSPSELSSYQRKIFKIDDHVGIAISGLTADARSLSKYMRNECLNHRFVYDSPLPINRLVAQVADSTTLFLSLILSHSHSHSHSLDHTHTHTHIHFVDSLRISNSYTTLWKTSIRCWSTRCWL
jgi:hypothetical protein